MKQNMSQKYSVRHLLLLFFVCLFLYSAYHLFMIWQEYRESEALYQAAQKVYTTVAPVKPSAESDAAFTESNEEMPNIDVDFTHLQEMNEDIVGWIWMQDSVIHYPLLQGESNDVYLYQTYDKKRNSAGSIFLDYRNDPGFQDDNTVIYGHNMKNGSMFASLKKFRQQDYYQTHKNFYIITPVQMDQYEVVAAFVTDALSNVYSRNFSDVAEKQRWLDSVLSSSVIATETQVSITDQFVTLSTCVSGNNIRERYVVVGRRVLEEASIHAHQEKDPENVIDDLAGEFQAVVE